MAIYRRGSGRVTAYSFIGTPGPTTATEWVRDLSRGARRKDDRIDAAGDACGAAAQGDARPVVREDRRRRARATPIRNRAVNSFINRVSASRICSAVLVHTNGFGLPF